MRRPNLWHSEQVFARSTLDERGATGRHHGHATNISGRWTAYPTPWACGREGGLVLGQYADAPAAIAVGDEYVSANADEPPR
jgi:hypothetical protein